MKISRHNADHISIHFSPAFLWIIGAVFILLSLSALLFFGTKTTLVCSRGGQAVCTLTNKAMLKSSERSIPINQLREAYVESNVDSEGDETYRVVLRTVSGNIPLTGSSSSGYAGKRDNANRINAFLQSTGSSNLSVVQDERLLAYILGAIFAGIGSLMVLLSSRVTLDLDRSTGLAVLSKTSLVTRSREEYLLEDLAGAEVQESSSSNSSTYRVALVQHSGARMPLTGYYSSGYKAKQNLADEINKFLNG